MLIVLMGVAGAGKTTIGTRLARDLGWSFYDADDFHPTANVAKMGSGVPLTDADRAPWLARLHEVIADLEHRNVSAVLACSALKAAYRAQLAAGIHDVRFVYLRASREALHARLLARTGHYLRADLLGSQLATLEVPADAIIVDAEATPPAVIAAIRHALGSG